MLPANDRFRNILDSWLLDFYAYIWRFLRALPLTVLKHLIILEVYLRFGKFPSFKIFSSLKGQGLLIFLLLFCANLALGQSISDIFLDADSTTVNKQGKEQLFEGNVVAIASDILLAADHIEINNDTRILRAKGHVLLATRSIVYSGDVLTYNMANENFQLINAQMVVGDTSRQTAIINDLLGISPGELQYEADRKTQLAKVAAEKIELKNKTIKNYGVNSQEDQKALEKYLALTEKERLIATTPNPFASLANHKSGNKLTARREYWESSRKKKTPLGFAGPAYYFKLHGDELKRENGNDFFATNASWTPCFCQDDDNPAWGFSTSYAFAQNEGYLSLKHAILQVKGVPILYMPYLKIPLKGQRQSGFLLPYFSHDSETGTMYSQPIFFAIADHYDSTFKIDYLQNRGIKLGSEFRFEQTRESGWQLRVEGLHDRKWVDDRALRESLRYYHSEGLAYAFNPDNPPPATEGLDGRDLVRAKLMDRSYWENLNWGVGEWGQAISPAQCLQYSAALMRACQTLFDDQFSAPDNVWRSRITWKGLTYLAPRLSLVSEGDLLSDHRYLQDLYLENEKDDLTGQDAFDILFYQDDARAYAKSKMKFHLDGRSYYASTGSSFADVLDTNEKFQGQQMPFSLKLKSRYFNLMPSSLNWPSYVQLGLETQKISEYQGLNRIVSLDPENPGIAERINISTPEDGSWNRFHGEIITPLVSKSFFVMNHFVQAEDRQIQFGGEAKEKAELKTVAHGIRFYMPIDGGAYLGENYEINSSGQGVFAQNFLRHLIDFEVTASLRPVVVTEGRYFDVIKSNAEYSYYQSDYQLPAKTLGLKLTQRWGISKKQWKKSENGVATQTEPENETNLAENQDPEVALTPEPLLSEREKVELEFEKILHQDSQNLNHDILASEQEDFTLMSKADTYFASWELYTQYDLEKERRKKEQQTVQNPEDLFPWTPLTSTSTLSYARWLGYNRVLYDMGKRFTRELDFRLSTPSYFKSRFVFGYEIDKIREETSSLQSSFSRSYLRSIGFYSFLIPDWSTQLFVRKNENDQGVSTISSELKAQYNDPSRCWGLSLRRNEDITARGRNPSYLVELNIAFLGKSRNLPDIGAGIVRELPESQQPPKP